MSDESNARIFISYARSDAEKSALELREKLVAEFGEDAIWRDRDEMEGGVGWWKQITNALDEVEYMVLLATPAAMASPVVRKEWRYARQQGACVYPVQVPELPVDFAVLPRWMSDSHFYNLDKEWKTFIGHLHSKCDAVRVPFYGVPDLPEHFVARPDVFERMKAQLLDEKRDNPVAITTSLVGAGGFGKTTLASALCHDDDIQMAFDEGILWVTLGENPNTLLILNGLYRTLTGEDSTSFETVHEASARFTEKLVDNDVLLVIDDIWDSQHAKPFVQGGERCARLMTTRFMNIALDNNAHPNDVDEMSPEQAVDMLLAGIDGKPDDQTDFVILGERLGEWALMLEIVNGILREALTLGDDIQGALDYVNEVLDEEGISGIEKDSGDERNQSAAGVLSASFRQLKETEKNALFELAIFLDDNDIPLTSLMALWKMGFARVRKQITRFARYSFVKYDAEKQTIRIHDVVREVLAGKLSATTELTTVHAKLIDNYGIKAGERVALPDDYAWRNIAYHLLQADRRDTLRELLLNIDFLQAKLNATEPHTLIADYDYFKDDEGIFLVQSGVKFISHKLLKDPSVLPVELGKCLAGYREKHSAIAILLESIESQGKQLIPLHQTFSATGGNLIRKLEGHSNSVSSVAIQEDFAISASWDKTLIVWNWQASEALRTLNGHSDCVEGLATQHETTISASRDKTLIVWNWQTGEILRTLTGHSETVNSVAIQNEIAISASYDNSLIVWNWTTGEQVRKLQGHTDSVLSVALSGDYAISASWDKSLIVWNWTTGEQVRKLQGHTDSVRSVALSGDYAISASHDKSLIVWNWTTGEQVRKLQGHTDYVRSVAIQREIAISTSRDKTLIVWNWQIGEVLNILTGHSNWVNNVRIQDEIAVSASDDKTLIVWNWITGETIQTITGHSKSVNSVAIQRETTISASDDHTFIVWNWITGEILRTLKGHSNWVNNVRIQDEIAISASDDKTLIVWNWITGETIRTLKGHSDSVNSVAIWDKTAISASYDKTLIVWNWTTGETIRTLKGHSSWVNSVAIQDEIAISASDDKTLIVWNWTTGDILHILKGHSDSVSSVAIQDEIAISPSRDKTLIVWNWQTSDILHTLKGHSSYVNSVAIQREIAISASGDKTLIVWNWQTGKRLATFNCDSPQRTVTIGDGVIVSGGNDGQVHFFHPNRALRKLLGW